MISQNTGLAERRLHGVLFPSLAVRLSSAPPCGPATLWPHREYLRRAQGTCHEWFQTDHNFSAGVLSNSTLAACAVHISRVRSLHVPYLLSCPLADFQSRKYEMCMCFGVVKAKRSCHINFYPLWSQVTSRSSS